MKSFSFQSVKEFVVKHKGLTALIAAAILIPSVSVIASGLYSGFVNHNINCLVSNSCSMVFASPDASALAAQGEQKFGSGVESSSFGGSTSIGSGGYPITGFFAASSTIDPNSIGNGSATTSQVTVSGAAVGNTVIVGRVGSLGAPTSSVSVVGVVSSSNTVTLTFQNNSSSAVNLTEAVYNVDVINP